MSDTISLSRLLKIPVVSGESDMHGRLVDVTAVLSETTPAVNQVVVRGQHAANYLVPWSAVDSWDEDGIRFSSAADRAEAYRIDGPGKGTSIGLADEEVLLGRDIMDSQVVDLAARHLARVSDVLLTGKGQALEVTAVDLGMGALLRRIGLGRLGRRQPKLVAWNDLHLANGRGHSVQLATEAEKLRDLSSMELAEVIARLATAPAVETLRAVGASRSAAALDMSHEIHRRRLLRAMPEDAAGQLAEHAPPDLARSLAKFRAAGPAGSRRLLRSAGWRRHGPTSDRP